MSSELVLSALSVYGNIGIIYGLTRSFYWLRQVRDMSYIPEKKSFVFHPPSLLSKFCITSYQVVISHFIWPIHLYSDIKHYNLQKRGFRDYSPSFPFSFYLWKDEN